MIRRGEDIEKDPAANRYMTEGICPNCHIPLTRTARSMAVCQLCELVWRSSRLENIFPKKVEEPQ